MRQDFIRGWRSAPVANTLTLLGFSAFGVLAFLARQGWTAATAVIMGLWTLLSTTYKGNIDRLRDERDDALERLYRELR